MDVVLTLEQRFEMTADGAVWTKVYPYHSFRLLLEVFDNVTILARASTVSAPPPDAVRANGPHVQFLPLPYYVGPRGFAKVLPRLVATLHDSVNPRHALLLRIPSPIAVMLLPSLLVRRVPYAVQVVGDPLDVLAKGTVEHPLRPLFRQGLVVAQKILCRRAIACAYVTESTLQQRYPSSPSAHQTHFSNVELPHEAFADVREFTKPARRLVTVGSLEQLYKGVDTLLDALARLPDMKLTVVGDGHYRAQLEAQSERLGLADRVDFVGHLTSSAAVRPLLDEAELFVLASRTEGLPRAMVEAMARGLPCIGTRAGGIPELLTQRELAPIDDPASLAEAIQRLAADPKALSAASVRNHAHAKTFHKDVLDARRLTYYRYIRDATQD